MSMFRAGSNCRAALDGECGFTLLELAIVIFLVGVMLVVSVPTLRDTLIDDPLPASCRKVIGYVSGVRDAAIREQQPYLLMIDLDENRLWSVLESEAQTEPPAVPEKGELALPENVEIRDIWTRAKGSVSRGVTEIWVSRQGYVDQTVLHLEDGDGEAISLLLHTFLPEIEIREGRYEPE